MSPSYLQEYLFHRLKTELTRKVEIEYDGSKLVKLVKVEDEENILPPPFSTLRANIKILSGEIKAEDPVVMI